MTEDILRKVISAEGDTSRLDAVKAGDLVDMLEFIPISNESHCGHIRCHLTSGESFLLGVSSLKHMMGLLDERCATAFVKISRKRAVNRNNMFCCVNKVIVMRSKRRILLEKWQNI